MSARPARRAVRAPLLMAMAACLAASLLVSLVPGRASAQQEERGWLGLGLQEQLQCRTGPAPAPRPCERQLVVVQVVVDGPADRAGVQPGDTLLAVAGQSVASPERREALLAALRPERPVTLTLGRAEGRVRLRLVPSRPPERVERVRGAEGPIVAPGPVAMRLPGPPGSEERDVVEVRTHGGQVVSIRRVPRPPAIDGAPPAGPARVPDPARLERRLQVTTTDHEALGQQLEAQQELLRSVLLELGPELREIQDSVFRQAREQFERIRQLHARELAVRRAARAHAVGAAPAPGADVWLPAHERRLAGAEFEPLGPELAEFFQAERGLLVLRVLPGTPADRIGLRPGDVVVEAGGAEVRTLDDLRRVLGQPEGPHRVRWNRKGRLLTGTMPE